MPRLSKPRKKRSIMIRNDLYGWIKEQVKKGVFWNHSHAVEVALIKLRDTEEEGKK